MSPLVRVSRVSVIAALLLVATPGVMAQIVINEILSSNASTNFDEDGDTSDWAELKNLGDSPVDVAGYSLSDDRNDVRKWILPSVTIPPQGYLVVWCSAKDRTAGVVPEIPELLAHWPLDEGQGSVFANAANDEYDGYLEPASSVGWGAVDVEAGEHGPAQDSAALFTGANSWIQTDFPGVSGNNPRSIAAWIKTSQRGGNDILGYGRPTNGLKWHFRVNTNSGNGLVGAIRTEYQGGQNIGTTVVDDGEWHHVAAVFPEGAVNGQEIVHYVDGVVQGRTGGDRSIQTGLDPAYAVTIGLSRQSATALRWFHGLIADVRIYDRGLNQQGVDAVMGGDEPPAQTVPLNLHTNFNLDSDGEELILLDPRGDTGDLVVYPQQYSDMSYARSPDGVGGFLYFYEPSPLAENSGASTDEPLFVADTKFLPNRGVYDAPLSVEITSETEGATIRFTLDGSEPTESHGSTYAGPIPVSDTTAIRAIAMKEGYESTNVDTHTYIFLETPAGGGVINQPQNPAGFPSTWGPNGGTADYEMDPRIATDTGSAYFDPKVKEALLALPTISIVMDVDDFFATDIGLQANPTQRGDNWERACSVEFIYPDDEESGHQVNAGIRIQGNASRQPSRPKHNMRLLFRNIYGAGKLRHALFDDTSVDEFDTLILRGGNGDAWFHPSATQQRRAQYVRDQWHRDIQQSMGRLTAHQRYMHLYINGLYWGMYHVFERPTAEFLASHLGGEPEDWDANNSLDPLDGDLQAWNTMMAIANAGVGDAGSYAEIQEYLDVPNLIDFLLINFYSGNVDWDRKNWYAGRRRAPGAGYMFFCWDSERTFWDLNTNRTTLNIGNRPSHLHQQLTANPEYRLLFADHVHRHFFNGGLLTPDTAADFWRARADEIELPMVAESARFGDNKRGTPYTVDAEWRAELDTITNSYMRSRTGVVLNQIRARGLYPNVDAPVFSPLVEEIEPGFHLSVVAAQGEVYYTLDSSDPRALSDDPSPNAVLLADGEGEIVLDETTRVRARARVGDVWSAVMDATFVTPSLSVAEIMYHPIPDGDDGFEEDNYEFVEIRNVSSTAVDLRGVRLVGDVEYDFAGGVVGTLLPGEYVVVVQDLEGFDRRYGIEDRGVTGSYRGRLSNNRGVLTLLGAVGETIQEVEFQDDWYAVTDGDGYSLVLRVEDALPEEASDPGAWRPSSSIGGSPGSQDLPGGLRLPGDLNADLSVDVSDAILLAAKLFQGGDESLPCGGTLLSFSNTRMADWNGDLVVDVSDVVTVLLHLFRGGAPHPLGEECRSFDACDDACP